jgi:hypothetical protein
MYIIVPAAVSSRVKRLERVGNTTHLHLVLKLRVRVELYLHFIVHVHGVLFIHRDKCTFIF